MVCLKRYLTFYLFVVVQTVVSFSPDTSSFDAYGLKLAANGFLLVESLPPDSSFFLRLAPFNYSLSCEIAYNDSNQYVYAVAVASEATYNDSIRFVFIGVNIQTDVPFIGSLAYTGIKGSDYAANIKSRRAVFPCTGWQSDNYHVHQFEQFVENDDNEDTNNDFFVVTVG